MNFKSLKHVLDAWSGLARQVSGDDPFFNYKYNFYLVENFLEYCTVHLGEASIVESQTTNRTGYLHFK